MRSPASTPWSATRAAGTCRRSSRRCGPPDGWSARCTARAWAWPERPSGRLPSSATGRPKVWFVGAGPGAADLLTFRGAAAIAGADVVVWAGSLVSPEVLVHARHGAELLDSSKLTLERVAAVYDRALAERLVVARVHSGDPTLYGAVQ